MSADNRSGWRTDLEAGPDCIPVDRIADSLTAAETAHLEECARCRTEHDVWHAAEAAPRTPGEQAVVNWIAETTRSKTRAQVLAPPAPRRLLRLPSWAPLAASVALVAGAAVLWLDRVPEIGPAPAARDAAYRSGRIEALAPLEDVDAPPSELRWESVDRAIDYEVRVFEVDGTLLWTASTTATRIDLPADVSRHAQPSRTLVWEVRARDRSGAAIARSGATRFRVKGKPVPPAQ